jgi:hypothetical protein
MTLTNFSEDKKQENVQQILEPHLATTVFIPISIVWKKIGKKLRQVLILI